MSKLKTVYFPGKPMMSTEEIAALTGKNKGHLHRDVFAVLKELTEGKVDHPKMDDHKNQMVTIIDGVTACVDGRGYVSEFLLDRKHTDIVITGYSIKYRAAIIERWHELEKKTAESEVITVPRTYKEALIHLVAQVEENERLTVQNEALDEALSIARPKAILMDRLAGTSEQLYGVNEAGRILGTSGAVMASCMDMVGNVFTKRKYSTTPRQFVKHFIDREYGRNVASANGGFIQAKFTFKGLCYIALHLVKRGIITVDAIPYRPCRDSVEAAMALRKSVA